MLKKSLLNSMFSRLFFLLIPVRFVLRFICCCISVLYILSVLAFTGRFSSFAHRFPDITYILPVIAHPPEQFGLSLWLNEKQIVNRLV